jgi:hypothetical protein
LQSNLDSMVNILAMLMSKQAMLDCMTAKLANKVKSVNMTQNELDLTTLGTSEMSDCSLDSMENMKNSVSISAKLDYSVEMSD